MTTKEDLQRHNEAFLCVPKREIVDYVTTSGTLGDPVTFALTESDLQRLAYNEYLSFSTAGITPDDIMQLMTTLDRRFMAGLAYFMGARELGCGIIRVGNGIPELQWDTIARIRPSFCMVVPSFLTKLIAYAEHNGIDHNASSLRKAVCIGRIAPQSGHDAQRLDSDRVEMARTEALHDLRIDRNAEFVHGVRPRLRRASPTRTDHRRTARRKGPSRSRRRSRGGDDNHARRARNAAAAVQDRRPVLRLSGALPLRAQHAAAESRDRAPRAR